MTASMCDLAESKELSDAVKITRYTINPKAQSMNRLYGAFDDATHEWANGVLAKTVRECAADQSLDKKWIVFDGPVDTLWIENMNTVLDDNKKLCLASGEIIKLSNSMSIVFEVDDLSVASPATISRVGMVYLEPKQLGWKPITVSWYNTLTEPMQQLKEKFEILFDIIFEPSVLFVLENTVSIIHLTAEGHITNLLRLLNTTLDPFLTEEKISGAIWNHLEAYFVYALVWSVGANTDTEGRAKFSVFLTQLLADLTPKLAIALPVDANKPNVSVYDFVYSSEKKKWLQWMDTCGKFEIAPTAKYQTITVPTVDTVRASYLLESLLVHHYRTLFTGPTGTGKSKIIYQKLLDDLPKDKWDPICITFSAQTTEYQAQNTVQDKLVKRTKTMRGPILGKLAVLFIDDLSMPEKEEFGAQPPLELFRQFCDYSGWYHENVFLKLVDVEMVAAMGTPGGGANVPSTRLTRHFNIIGFVPYDAQSLQRIFSSIVNWWTRNNSLTAISKLIPKMIQATIDIYSTLKQQLKPTPEKSHYTFNLRDMSKVFGGILNAAPKYLKGGNDLIRVWSHECQRVFSDRLINMKDIEWFNKVLCETTQTHFNVDFVQKILDGDEGKPLFYTHFHTECDPPEYTNCDDFDKLKGKIEEILSDYNAMSASPMDLVLFEDAISHICRISRIMNQPAGSALLVGVGGSGRQSLTKLATSIAEYELFQVQVSSAYSVLDWKEDLKKLCFTAGLEDKHVVFLFNDTQIKFESMLEDINNILNNGEVPGLMGPEDTPQIIDSVSQIAKKEGKPTDLQSVLSLFVEKCKNNIHIFLCLSPIGDDFRTRLRRFPSLVNCCTIDWFHRWPEQALKSVANRYLSGVDLAEDIKIKVVDACVTMQETVIEIADEFAHASRINTYVTPTSYLDLLQTFKNLFEKSRTKIGEAKQRYDIGLDKLKSTEQQVKQMQQQLEELQPQLEQSVIATNKLMKEIQVKTKDADAKKAVVAVEEAQCNKQAAEAKEQADECQKELDVALPAYEQAMAALKVIKKSDLAQVKKYSKPPPGVVLTMEAVCIMMGVKPKKVGQVGKKVDDYWDQAKKYVLGDTKLLEKLQNYDKDNIPIEIMQKVGPYIDNPEFEPEKIASASGACKGLCLWTRALHTYDRVAKVVKPKQEALKKAQAEVAEAMANLATKKAELKKITDLLDDLNAQFKEANDNKENLQNQVEECGQRLERAEKLISGLGGEYKSWNIKSENLAQDYENVVGDIVIASGIIAYLGIYTSVFRQKIINKWVKYLKTDLEISCSDPFSLVNTLGDPIQIREWIISKLPKDEFSITNAIIFDKSIKFPLFVDPQGQGNRWIKNMEKDNELTLIKLSDHMFGRTLENCIQFGKPLLIENVGETLDPILEPLLLKQIIVSGNRKMIQLGEQTVDYDDNFRLYITTKLSTPHYTPTVSTKVVLLNFAITLDGLDDQMLGIVVGADESEMEKKREEIVIEQAAMNKKLVKLEDTILRLLSEAKGNILDDEVLIDTLQKSKTASKTIEKRMGEAKIVEKQINNVRQQYSWLSRAAANLFFVVADMSNIDPMYQYSLDWFLNLFMRAIETAPPSDNKKERTGSIDGEFKRSLYRNVCRSLFAKDKLLFSFILCARILSGGNQLNMKEFRFVLTGAGLVKEDKSKPNPFSEWMDDKMWAEIRALSVLSSAFHNLDTECINDTNLRTEFKRFYDSPKPHEFETYLPSKWNSKLNVLQKLCVLRCFRMDCMVPAIQAFVSRSIGAFFVRPPAFDLEGPFSDSNCVTPIIFILSSGSDPMNELLKLAKKHDMHGKDRMFSISLGQGQGPVAAAAIEDALDQGTWVILQNCHLAPSWMPSLEKIIENLNAETINPSFRLWLTAMPSADFPLSILQNGVKVTNEPPKGIQANLRQTYQSLDKEWFESCTTANKEVEFKKSMFALAFFHSIVQERRKFGPLGWNIPYQFNESDLRISFAQLHMFLNNESAQSTPIPWKQLQYMTGQLNYGGRVTDDKDRRCLMSILDSFYTPKLIEDKEYKFSVSKHYFVPEYGTNGGGIADYLKYIDTLPLNDDPSIFGLHSNANISCAISEANQLLSNALALQGRSSGEAADGGEDGAEACTQDEQIMKLARDIESRIPDLFDIASVSAAYPVSYSESMNTVLVQELLRFNRLLAVIKKSLKDLQAAIRGEVVMSSELERLGDSIFNLRVPSAWQAVSYPSLKPLASYITDLLDRLSFFRIWIEKAQPSVYWLSGFFFTQSFLTGALQNYARKYEIPIDELGFTFQVMSHEFGDELNHESDNYNEKFDKYIAKIEPPQDGCYVYGLYLEGASWNWKQNQLHESKPKQLFCSMPIIWFKPTRMNQNESTTKDICYDCPVYKTSRRAGSLSTTGHSTNYVLTTQLPTDKAQKHWILRGVAMLTQLDN
eukprot:482434_1